MSQKTCDSMKDQFPQIQPDMMFGDGDADSAPHLYFSFKEAQSKDRCFGHFDAMVATSGPHILAKWFGSPAARLPRLHFGSVDS